MLRPNVKEYAESGNIRGLHYIFRDALDADPTFEDWQESYDYCERLPGFFELHKELTPFVRDSSQWNESYWIQLKMDLMENFSKERYEHLRRVAQVFYAEKIERIRLEEAQRRPVRQEPVMPFGQNTRRPQPKVAGQGAAPAAKKQALGIDLNAQEDERIRLQEKELEEENRKADEAQRKNEQKVEQMQKNLARENHETRNGGSKSKKLLGVALAAVVLVLAIILLFHGNPNAATAAIAAQKASQEMLAGLSGSL